MTFAPPDPRPRCRFAHYLFERRLGPRDVAPLLGCSHEQVRRVCLPFDDPDWRRPSEKLKQKVAAWTGGAVSASDWPERERVST
jgi:hypothetical protein